MRKTNGANHDLWKNCVSGVLDYAAVPAFVVGTKITLILPVSVSKHQPLALMKKDRVVWYWIGNHSDYDRLI